MKYIFGILFCLFLVGSSLCAPAFGEATADTSAPPALSPEQIVYEQALSYSNEHEWLSAKRLYQQLLRDYPDFSEQAKIREKLGETNIFLIRSGIALPQSVSYLVQPGDSIDKLAKKFGTTVELIKAGNNLKNTLIHPGQSLRLWTEPFDIIIDKSENILTLLTEEEIIKVYLVATGAGNITPVGEFTITSKLKNPVWFHKGEIIAPDNPRNALGTRWLGLDNPQYGIHGTIQPALIGQQVSHGCVRMFNSDIEELYDLVPLGTRVIIVD